MTFFHKLFIKRQFCGVKKDLDERIDEGVLWWFGHIERMERDRIAKRVYLRECAGTFSVGRPWKRWIDTVKECLRKRGLDVRQGMRMAGVCKEESMRRSPGDESLTLMRCHSYMKPLKGRSPTT